MLGLSQASLGRAFGKTGGYVSLIEHGRHPIPQDLCIYLAAEHGVNLNWLLTGNGPWRVPEAGSRGVTQAHYSTWSARALGDEVCRRLEALKALEARPTEPRGEPPPACDAGWDLRAYVDNEAVVG